jgi:putative ABC transport system substrate-binding protein
MKRREFITLLGGVAAWPLAAQAQQVRKLYRIGLLGPGSGPPTALLGAFTEGLHQLGWIEGQNFIFERRPAEWLDRMAQLAGELVDLDVDVIVASGTLAPLAAKRVTATIPIVMTSAGDPLGSGLVASLARPGGNVTGLSLMAPDLGGKRLEMLKEFAPSISRVAVIWNAANPYSALVFGETKGAAHRLGLEVQSIEVRVPADFDYALEAATGQRASALVAVEDPLTLDYRKKIVDFAAKNRLPAIYGLRQVADDGGLIAYGANVADLFRRAAGYVDKIFKGAKPADLPVQQPTKFELVINLKAAKALGLEVPPTLLARADEVIE